MFLFRKAIILATVATFAAQPMFALTLQRVNVPVGGGVFAPAIIVTEGPGAGTYKIGDSGLTRNTIYNEDALKAWAAQMAGVAASTITIYDPEANASSDNCKKETSFDADLMADTLIYVAGTTGRIKVRPCFNPHPCDIGLGPNSGDQLILTQIIDCAFPANRDDAI